jgi:raffinose/stachyose/melibiose transport system substrate-binding protein
MRFAVLASALMFALAGCATTATTTTPTPEATPVAAQDTAPADDALNAVAWYQTSAERDLVYRTVYRAAAPQLQAALADNSKAHLFAIWLDTVTNAEVANAYLSGVEGVISGSKTSKDVMTGVQQAAAKAKKQAG